MERITALLCHRDFLSAMAAIEQAEVNRPFCGHGPEHLLSVARIMALLARERGSSLSPALIYGAALLHDLGRAEEYRSGQDHHHIAPELARPLLQDCGFSDEEIAEICTALPQHSSHWQGERSPLGELLFLADKKSRLCLLCRAAEDCNWPMEKRNLQLEY